MAGTSDNRAAFPQPSFQVFLHALFITVFKIYLYMAYINFYIQFVKYLLKLYNFSNLIYNSTTLPVFDCFYFLLAMQQFYVEHLVPIYLSRIQILLEGISLIQ